MAKERPRSGAWQVVTEIKIEDLIVDGKFHPPVEKKYLEITPPTITDNLSDLTRVIRSLKQIHQIGNIYVDFYAVRKMASALREKDWKVTVTLANSRKKGGKVQLINIEPGDTTSQNFAVAVDIGTTTVWGQLLDLNNGEILAQPVEYNAQIGYGEDVISRIAYAQKAQRSKKNEGLGGFHHQWNY